MYDGGQHMLPFVLLRYSLNRRLRQGQRETHALPLSFLYYPPNQHLRQGQCENPHAAPRFASSRPPTSGGFFFGGVYDEGQRETHTLPLVLLH